ncbi:hypothetical protein KUCAC02_018034 [Chaenocephalus aceratus]|uniref:Uncharacterized protein n=1 Tax=Chaenocephalus aceratus TaxID=36190 RepID=A0ACB9W842_CHAAC|nr:hypothetical protein KUCAC02_018034 [Chaenocephalus aceratus]
MSESWPSSCGCCKSVFDVREKTLRALKVPLGRPVLLLMGCQKLSVKSTRLLLTRQISSTGLDRMLAAGGYVPPGISPGQLSRLEAVVPVCPAFRGLSTPAPLQPTGLLFPATGSPPHLLSVGLERRGHDLRGLKLELLVKKSWNEERKHPFQAPVSSPLFT